MPSLLPPAIARWPQVVTNLGLPGVFGIADLCLLPLVGWDLATRGRLHRATLWGALLIIASLPLRLVISATVGWLAFADWAVALVR